LEDRVGEVLEEGLKSWETVGASCIRRRIGNINREKIEDQRPRVKEGRKTRENRARATREEIDQRTILQSSLQQDLLGSSRRRILWNKNILPLDLEYLRILNEKGLQPREGGGGRSRDERGRVGRVGVVREGGGRNGFEGEERGVGSSYLYEKD